MSPTVADVRSLADERPITMLTAYDAPTARIADEAGIDVLLVGDSMGNTALGYEDTLKVTLSDVLSRTAAVSRATEEALVVSDMPFLSFGVSEERSIENAGRLLTEGGASAVKLECGAHTVELTRRLVDLGIPVMAHLGLTPQHVNQLGGYGRQGTTTEAAERIAELSRGHEEAGAFSLVLEHVPANLATAVTDELSIPTIGIGAGPDCDGQVLVVDDVIGLGEWSPPFSKRFGDVRGEMSTAIAEYRESVASGEFPADEHSHVEEELEEFY
jgi:3-methyl-2-oxobutanoate hydroxymethyltransferase